MMKATETANPTHKSSSGEAAMTAMNPQRNTEHAINHCKIGTPCGNRRKARSRGMKNADSAE